jgi:hypothetical protein
MVNGWEYDCNAKKHEKNLIFNSDFWLQFIEVGSCYLVRNLEGN